MTLSDLVAEALCILEEFGLSFDSLEIDAGFRRKPKQDHLWYVANSGIGRSGRPWLMVTAGDAKITGDVSTPRVVYKSWETDQESVTEEEAAEIYHQIERSTRKRQELDVRRRKSAAEQARKLWSSAQTDVDGHPYLATKGIKPHGLRRYGNDLLVPVADLDGNFHGLQSIGADGGKRFNPGAAVGGHFHMIGIPDGLLYLAEGYATAATIHEVTGAAVAVCFNAGNLEPVAKLLRQAHPEADLVVCADDDQWTEGNPGRTKASAAAAVAGGSIVAPTFQNTSTKPTDFNDLARLEGLEAVRAQLQQEQEVEETTKATLVRLAALSPLDYDRIREEEAARLEVRVSTLDKEVKQRRKTVEQESTPLVEEVEPWPAPVDGAELLEEVRTTVRRYMVLPDGAAEALALWVLGSYCFDAFRIWPKLTLTSPEKRCGKSTLLGGILTPLVHRGLVTSNISPAAIFRVIEAWTPSLMIDEADTFLHGNDELRGVINSGHTKSGAFVVRTVGDEHEPKKFSTWAPMALAMIKTPPGTILDRSVVIRLRRKLPGERVDKLPLTFEDNCLAVRRRCKRWADDHMDVLQAATPSLPASANDRALDNWTPLLAIAETVGGNWPAAAVAAFHHLTIEDDDDAIGPMILEDVKRVFEEQRVERLHSADLVCNLIDLEERPWSEWRRGKPLTTTSLARLLKPYRIKSKQLRIGATNRHGYELTDFRDAFDRYLTPTPSTPPFQNATPLHPSNDAGYSRIQNATPGTDVAFQNPRQPSNDKGCSVVASQNGGAKAAKGGPDHALVYKEDF